MTRYAGSFVLAGLGIGLLFLFHTPSPGTVKGGHTAIGMIDWSIIAALGGLALLSVWGIVGVALSKIKARSEDLASQAVDISKKSWHYRLNTWANGGYEPSDVRSECEYWPRLFHGLYAVPFIRALGYVICSVILLLAWFFGQRPNGLNIYRDNDSGRPILKPGHQFIGPTALALLLIGGLAAGLMLSGAGADAPHAPWLTIGRWSGVVTGGIIGGIVSLVAILFLADIALHAIRPPFSYAVARVIRVCRPIRFVD